MQPNYISILQKSGGTIVKISRYFVVGIYKSINKELNIRVEKQGKRDCCWIVSGKKTRNYSQKSVEVFFFFFYDGRIGSVFCISIVLFFSSRGILFFLFLNKKEKNEFWFIKLGAEDDMLSLCDSRSVKEKKIFYIAKKKMHPI